MVANVHKVSFNLKAVSLHNGLSVTHSAIMATEYHWVVGSPFLVSIKREKINLFRATIIIIRSGECRIIDKKSDGNEFTG